MKALIRVLQTLIIIAALVLFAVVIVHIGLVHVE